MTNLHLLPPTPAAGQRHDGEPRPDPGDQLAPVSGILDIHGGQALVRVGGYLPDAQDVPIPPALVHRYDLRRGDLITGAVRDGQPPQGERRNPRSGDDRDETRRSGAHPSRQRQPRRGGRQVALARVDTVNGAPARANGGRPDFYQLTPLYPRERLRLETTSAELTTRVVDLLTPIGKGQRALIVSPPKAGKTTVLQAIAQAVTVNHPECHLMALLVDERPEEVTQMRRSVDAEVVASTFDRHPTEHVAVAELAIARAQRLVELGRDVVIVLDSITRLGRAYNLAAPGGGRTLSGGIDSTALHGPKRLLGAARNIENGGSLTIIASALVETGSAGDTLIFEEFKSTGNAELRLLRSMADRRVFPAVDIESSGTRREDLLLAPDELALVQRLRRSLRASDSGRTG